MSPTNLADPVQELRSNTGDTLLELSQERPILVVFLRHAGCTFCREALRDLQQQRKRIEASGNGIALVHMTSDDAACKLFRKYGLDDVPRFSDPERKLYRAFELQRGSLWQLLGPSVWLPGAKALASGNGIGVIQGDATQLAGTFVVQHGKIVQAFRNKTSADKPDYAEMAEACACAK